MRRFHLLSSFLSLRSSGVRCAHRSPASSRLGGLALFALATGCVAPSTEATGRSGAAVTVGDTFNFGTAAHPGSCMDALGAGTDDGTQIQQYGCNGTGAQSYRLDDAGNGVFTIVNTNADKCVDVQERGTANGTKIQLYDCNQTTAQTFTAEDAGDGFISFVNTNSNKCLDVQGDDPNDGTVVQLYDCNGTDAQRWNPTVIGGASSGGGSSSSGGTSGGGGTSSGGGTSPGDGGGTSSGTVGPIDLDSAAIYSVYTPIYSQAGTLAAVTADLTRIHDLGFNVVYLLPVTALGRATGDHPSFGSPYCVHDYYAIDSTLGAQADLVTLVQSAHALGLHVILDEVLNHTAWDNALITQHPEYYVHSDGNPENVSSIEEAFNYADVAQLDYKTTTNGVAAYMTSMLAYWVQTYDLDGFRFDSADNPYDNGMITQAFWQGLAPALAAVKPRLLLLGEEEDPALAEEPFELDYGWDLQGLYGAGGLQQVANGGSAQLLQTTWTSQKTGYPSSMRHMTLLQDWDLDEDLKMYGGTANTMAAATFAFTIDGVPLLFNGEEVGNDNSSLNTHTVIDWGSSNAASFTAFYRSLLALRNGSSALQQGAVTWISNSSESQVASFTRSDSTGTFLVAINFSGSAVSGSLDAPSEGGWTDVSPAGSPGGTSHASPPALALGAYDFEVFRAQ